MNSVEWINDVKRNNGNLHGDIVFRNKSLVYMIIYDFPYVSFEKCLEVIYNQKFKYLWELKKWCKLSLNQDNDVDLITIGLPIKDKTIPKKRVKNDKKIDYLGNGFEYIITFRDNISKHTKYIIRDVNVDIIRLISYAEITVPDFAMDYFNSGERLQELISLINFINISKEFLNIK